LTESDKDADDPWPMRKTVWENSGMVKPTKARMFASERVSRPVALGLAIGDLLWEGVNKLWEHLLLTWIVERLRDQAATVFLQWTVDHYILFFFVLVILYLAFVCVRAMFGRGEDQGDRGLRGDGPNISQERAKGAHAGIVGSVGDIDRSNVNIGGTQNLGPVIYQSGPPASPQLSVTKWIPIPENHALAGRGQSGFEIVNDGGVAYDVLLEDFAIDADIFVKSAELERVEANGICFALAWIDGYGHSPIDNPKWKLLDAMREASKTGIGLYQPDYAVPISIVYRDSEDHWFRGFATLSFIPSQGRLELSSTRRSPRLRCDIKEGFFQWGDRSRLDEGNVTRSDLIVTLSLQIVNDGASDLSITEVELTIRNQGVSFRPQRGHVVLPQPHQIKRSTPYHEGAQGLTSRVTQRVGDIPFPFTIAPNRPLLGLVQFILTDLKQQNDSEFQDRSDFVLEFLDARGNKHRVARPAARWERTGDLIPYDEQKDVPTNRDRVPLPDPDRRTLEGLQERLPSASIAQLRTQNFFGTFRWEFDSVLVAFQQWGFVPEHRFLESSLEQIHERLRDAVKALLHKVHYYSEKLPGGDGLGRGFSPLGKIEDMAAFEAHRNNTYEAAQTVCEVYGDLILTAQRIFAGVAPTRQGRSDSPQATKSPDVILERVGDMVTGTLQFYNRGDAEAFRIIATNLNGTHGSLPWLLEWQEVSRIPGGTVANAMFVLHRDDGGPKKLSMQRESSASSIALLLQDEVSMEHPIINKPLTVKYYDPATKTSWESPCNLVYDWRSGDLMTIPGDAHPVAPMQALKGIYS
jgi:hypothetical protein